MFELAIIISGFLCFLFLLIYSYYLTGGVREGKMIDFETSRLHFPEDYPDTGACAQEELLEAHTLTTQHSKYPPAKRPNFDKLCTNSPFWSVLCNSTNISCCLLCGSEMISFVLNLGSRIFIILVRLMLRRRFLLIVLDLLYIQYNFRFILGAYRNSVSPEHFCVSVFEQWHILWFVYL